MLSAGEHPLLPLQQAAHESGGVFVELSPAARKAPLQHLLHSFGASRLERESTLRPPPKFTIDMRATSILTGKRVDIGYCCFVCLSVFEEAFDECPVCHTKQHRG